MIGPFSSNMYLPSLSSMTAVFGTTVSTVQLTVSVYALGLAAGILVYGPLSDRFGRRPVLLASLAIYLGASVACAFAPDIEFLIAARFVQAFGACGGGNLGRAIVRDSFDRSEIPRILSLMASVLSLAPAVAPIVGGYLQEHLGWQSTFMVMAIMGATILLSAALFLEETNRNKNPAATSIVCIYHNARTLLTNRCYLGNALVAGLSFGALFSYSSNSAFVFIDVLHLSAREYGHTFMALAGSYFTGALLGARMSVRLGASRMVPLGLAISVGAISTGCILAWGGWMSIWTVLPIGCLQYFANALIQPSSQAGAITPFPRMAGTASSLLGFSQMAFAAGISWLISAQFDHTTRPLLSMMLLCATLALLVWLFVLPRSELACEIEGGEQQPAPGGR